MSVIDEGIKVTIESKPGQIRFLSSEYADQICVELASGVKKSFPESNN